MAWDVLDNRMYTGLKLMINAHSNIEAYSDSETPRSASYYLISNEDIVTGSPGTGSSTFIGTFNIDFYSNKKVPAYVKNNKSKIIEILGDYNHYSTSSITYFFNGEILGVENAIEDDPYIFRIKYQITHEKVS